MDIKITMMERRSIRKYKADPVSDEMLLELMEAARLAPSGTNHQPWRFIVVKNQTIKEQIQAAAFNQKFLSQAPILLVCCADLMTYANDTKKRLQELIDAGVFGPEAFESYPGIDQPKDANALKAFIPHAMLNVGLAMEHIALRAVSLGLGTCFVQLMKAKQIAQILEMPEHLVITGLMPVGFPDQNPVQRPRVSVQDIIYKVVD
ncbi:nitroreductase family protein [Desulfosporosinus sp.]|uniref:nitroreductase family protein n=1 Tax=Desulfosporosinus sp. TaxID=157907 RepID=UPI0025C6807E|nr:nitroreductase family protein [Desulfosporosinus sp.]MBC2723969.1 nitroreductase family protein [Desulfosporosinus sp.]MBC2725250.1 nitroreductase family protein [Desulfosporosinus sp.]